MSLATQRIIASYQEGAFADWQAKINATAGTELTQEVDWESFIDESMDEAAHHSFWSNALFAPQVAAFEQVCADDMGKAAVKDGIEKVVLRGQTDALLSYGCAYENKVLTITLRPFNGESEIESHATDLVNLLSSSL